MKKRLTVEQFERAVRSLDIGRRPLTIARAVLVEGQAQVTCAKKWRLTRSAVSQVVTRVWEAHESHVPAGYERIDAIILPKTQALIVRQWAEEAREKLRAQKTR